MMFENKNLFILQAFYYIKIKYEKFYIYKSKEVV